MDVRFTDVLSGGEQTARSDALKHFLGAEVFTLLIVELEVLDGCLATTRSATPWHMLARSFARRLMSPNDAMDGVT
jgi:hypothetical protein